MPVNGRQIGKIIEKGDCEFEWSISDIFSFANDGVQYYSPKFFVSNSEWYLCFATDNQTSSVRWISFFIFRKDTLAPPAGVNIKFYLKTAGDAIEIRPDFNFLFKGDYNGYRHFNFLRWSELMRQRTRLRPSDTFTLACNFTVIKTIGTSSRLDVLSQNIVDMFTSKKNCDATLRVKQQIFPVHKFVLSARSPVFAAMFDIDMIEKETSVVDIPDCDPRAFNEFLLYLYSGKVENLPQHAIELYKIADKYDVRELKTDCAISIMDNLTVDIVLEAYFLGHQFNEDELKFIAQKFFNSNFGNIVVTRKWETFMREQYVLANELLKEMAMENNYKL